MVATIKTRGSFFQLKRVELAWELAPGVCKHAWCVGQIFELWMVYLRPYLEQPLPYR